MTSDRGIEEDLEDTAEGLKRAAKKAKHRFEEEEQKAKHRIEEAYNETQCYPNICLILLLHSIVAFHIHICAPH
jgi:thymidylate kinase